MSVPALPRQAALIPVQPFERIEVIDILRGFALLGVLAANMKGFAWPVNAYYGGPAHIELSSADRIAEGFILLFIRYKFISLFSFLFGVGFSVQMLRAEARGGKVVLMYLRRSMALFVFGVAHLLLLWMGDILYNYALTAVLLLPLRDLSLRKIRYLMLGLVLAMPMLVIFGSGSDDDAPKPSAVKAEFTRSIEVHQQGTYSQLFRYRLTEVREEVFSGDYILTLIFTLILFLMGLYAGRMQIFQDPSSHFPFIRKVSYLSLGIGLPSNVLYLAVQPWLAGDENLRGLSELLFALFGPLLFLSYVGGFLFLLQDPIWKKRLSVLAPAGRMALTNYLMQSLICTTLFNGYGFGLFGKVGPALGLLLTIVIFAFQLWLSEQWFQHYQFGPMEWIWRTLTYGHAPQMRLAGSAQS